ncbi:MAG: DUF3048 C-terminal domain-containing protein [Anaerolineales bacterium]|nr:DUF3048 C-terminal domain-containing protein [Anaerolineales bacterium]
MNKFKILLFISLVLTLLIAACSAVEESAGQDIYTPKNETAELSVGEPEVASAPAGPSAVMSEISGDVAFRLNKATAFDSPMDGSELFLNAQVQTGSDGRVRLDFADGTLVRVTPNSLFTLTEIEERNDGLFKRLSLGAGQMWIVLNGGSLEVETASGVASVRGSYLMVTFDPDTGNIRITCLEGTCALKVNGEEVVLGAGEKAEFTGSGIEAGLMSQEDIQAWLDSTPEAELVLHLVPAAVGDRVWEDLNGNGLQDEDEPGLPGVTVSLVDLEGEAVATTQTDGDGQYLFTDVPAGEYSLEFFLENTLFTVQDAGEDDGLDSDVDRDGKTGVFALENAGYLTGYDAGMVYPGHAGWCPLTGLPTDADLLQNRPIFISISKFPAWATRPAVLAAAPVVFETLIDEGQTRLQALYYCGYPQTVAGVEAQGGGQFDISGVRSGRVFYAELAQLFGAGLIFGGADAKVYQTIAPYQCGVVDNVAVPNNPGGLGMDVESLQNVAESCKHRLGNPDLNVWQFGAAPSGGQAAANFLMDYNYLNQTRWIYDAKAGGYVRYENDPAEPKQFTLSTDKLTGEAIVRQNVILLETPHEVLNSSGTIINFDLTDERGYAYLLRDGMMHKACWSAVFDDYPTESNRYRPFLLYDCDTKEPVNFAYGSTWVNVVDASFWFESDGEYLVAKQPFLGYAP